MCVAIAPESIVFGSRFEALTLKKVHQSDVQSLTQTTSSVSHQLQVEFSSKPRQPQRRHSYGMNLSKGQLLIVVSAAVIFRLAAVGSGLNSSHPPEIFFTHTQNSIPNQRSRFLCTDFITMLMEYIRKSRIVAPTASPLMRASTSAAASTTRVKATGIIKETESHR